MDHPGVNRRIYWKQDCEQDWRRYASRYILGIVGAVIGGWVFNRFGAAGVTGLNLYSLLVAVIGSVLFLVIYHAIRKV
jgi:Predicted membrane protein